MSPGPRERPRVYPLRDYALLADGERGALVDPEGNIAWMCAPRWHDPAVFSCLIGGRSAYSVTPAGRFVWGGHYEPRSLIWCSRWVTVEAIVECREALALPATTDRAVILRRVKVCEGSARLHARLDPGADFDSRRLGHLRRDEHGLWQGSVGDLQLQWHGAAQAAPESGHRLELDLKLDAGAQHDLVLVIGEPLAQIDPDLLWQLTATAWSQRVPELAQTIAPRDACQSLAVLAGLTSSGGGMVAAATMALPERAREGSSYDYRYAWIRDCCYAGHAAAAAGADQLAAGSLRFARERLLEHGRDLRPAYTAQGARVPREVEVGLPGYPGGTDIVGNRVTDQFQLDAFGEIMLLIAACERRDLLETDDWRAAELAAQVVAQRWQEPDAGVWELAPDEWTHSRLIAAAGLRALAGCTRSGAPAARWSSLADEIVADCSRRSLHHSGRWQRSPTDRRLDASLLMGALRGAIPHEDPRSATTIRAVIEELTQEHFVYRFRPDERALGEAEGAFLLCNFWMALACAQQGDLAGGLRFFERARSACGSPGLFAEEHDVDQRQLRGNLPQAFVHALLLETAAKLS